MGKNEEDLDNSYLVLSDSQREIIHKNNVFALRLFDKLSGHSSQVVSPMSVAYLMVCWRTVLMGELPARRY